MRYGSVCSGIEAATAAWHPLSWTPAFFSEIDNFPRAVLQHHYPAVPLHGDFTTIGKDAYDPIDLLVGGTPCQAFSVAGLRQGFADARGNLTLEFVRLAERLQPRWLVWENVPGVLSQDGGRAFGSFLGGLAELGYGFAYRVLDAQHFGVPQRRRRVFVVGRLGDWRPAAAVLFERESLLGDTTPRRKAGESAASHPARCLGEGCGSGRRLPAASRVARCLNRGANRQDGTAETYVTHALRADGFDASEDGTGRGTPLVPVAFSCKDHGADAGDTAPTLRAMGHAGSHPNAGGQVAVAFQQNTRDEVRLIGGDGRIVGALAAEPGMKQQNFVAFQTRGSNLDIGDISGTLGSNADRASGSAPMAQLGMAVRRLTPRECERLQGFPDDFTLVPYRGKAAADGPRYKALGNSMAVPVMAWLGERIARIEGLQAEFAA